MESFDDVSDQAVSPDPEKTTCYHAFYDDPGAEKSVKAFDKFTEEFFKSYYDLTHPIHKVIKTDSARTKHFEVISDFLKYRISKDWAKERYYKPGTGHGAVNPQITMNFGQPEEIPDYE